MGLYTPALIGYAAKLAGDRTHNFQTAGHSAARLLTQKYRGPAMLVRRSSDNTTDAINFKNGLLDTTSLLAFCGTGSGFVQTLYNQYLLGSSGDVSQSTLTAQPRIVSGGVLQTWNGQPAMLFSGGQYLCSSTASQQQLVNASNGSFSGSVVANVSASLDQALLCIGTSSTGLAGGQIAQVIRRTSGQWNATTLGSGASQAINGTSASANLAGSICTGSALTVYQNGNNTGSAALSLTPENYAGYLVIGALYGYSGGVSLYVSGTISESVHYAGQQSLNDQAIFDLDRAKFYGISGVTQ